MNPWRERPHHSPAACAELIKRLLLEPSELRTSLDHEGLEGTSDREVIEALGRVLWDVFSDNHTVVDSAGTAYHLGSFRAAGGFIADVLNERYRWPERPYHYLDFYMGSLTTASGDLHRWIFTRLHVLGCEWIYSFPRLHLIDLRGLDPARHEPARDPSEGVRLALEEADRERDFERLSEQLDQAHEEAVQRARHEPLPHAVMAYRDVFGVLPHGWPHPDM